MDELASGEQSSYEGCRRGWPPKGLHRQRKSRRFYLKGWIGSVEQQRKSHEPFTGKLWHKRKSYEPVSLIDSIVYNYRIDKLLAPYIGETPIKWMNNITWCADYCFHSHTFSNTTYDDFIMLCTKSGYNRSSQSTGFNENNPEVPSNGTAILWMIMVQHSS